MPLLLAVLLAAAAARSDGRWTFCVAESRGDIWITDVFSAPADRAKLESAFARMLRAQGVARPDTQCPEPRPDKTDVVNAQFTAAEFHRKLGEALRVAAPPRIKR